MKIKALTMVCKEIEMDVDEKFRQLDGWHDISYEAEEDLREELESLIFENDPDCEKISCVWTDDTDETLLEN